MLRTKRIFIAVLALVLMLAATSLMGQIAQPRAVRTVQPTLSPKSIATVLPSRRLGLIQNAQLGGLNSLCGLESKMFGAGDGKVVELGENGQVLRTLPTKIKTPILSDFGADTLILGDAEAKVIHKMDAKSGQMTLLLNLNSLAPDAQMNVPNGELIKQTPLSGVAFDGKFVYASFSGGFSSPVFKIDPATRRIVGRGFTAGPNPNSMTFQNSKLLILDQKAQQIRNYGADLKPSQMWTEVSVPDAKGIAIIKNEVRVLSPSAGGIIRLNTNLARLAQTVRPTTAISPILREAVEAWVAQPRKYAVLICGDIAENFWGECFWNDTVWMYKTLLQAGYTKENIYVLYGYGQDYNSANPRYRHSETVTDYPATVPWVRRVFDGLKNGDTAAGITKMKDNDTLFVWTFDHGGGGTTAALCLWDGVMWDTEFATKLNAVPYAKRAIFMQQCRSGGFIDNLQNNKTFISTACRHDQNAFPADTENEIYNGKVYSHGEYNYHIITALSKLTPTGGAVNADNNGNGKISSTEAHNWNVARNSITAETPQVSDLAGVGAGFYLD